MKRLRNPEVPVPPAMQHLPIVNGYHKPWFVLDKDFRVTDPEKYIRAHNESRCFICGGVNKKKRWAFVHGPVSAQTRRALDAPAHEDCARYALRVCPFIMFPNKARTYEDGLEPEEFVTENPGVFYISVVMDYFVMPMPSGKGVMFGWDDAKTLRVERWERGSRSADDHLCLERRPT